VVYYGDEFGKQNDHNFYKEQIQLTGKDDTRFLVRGRIDWEQLEKELAQPESLSYQVYHLLSRMLKIRSQYPLFGRGDIQWMNTQKKQLLMYQRSLENEKILVVQNLSNQSVVLEQSSAQWSILTGHNYEFNNQLSLNAYGFVWAILK
jgi:maltose alpha-D-glucosyltransferase/alpha-amylase